MSEDASEPAAEHPRRRAPRRRLVSDGLAGAQRPPEHPARDARARARGDGRSCSTGRTARRGRWSRAARRRSASSPRRARMYGPASSIAAIEAAARARGYWVSTANIDPSDPQSIPAGLAHLIAQSIEGLVVIAPQVRVFRALAAQPLDIPYVTLQSTGPRPGPHAVRRPDGGRPPRDKTPDQPGTSADLPPRRTAGLDRGRGADARASSTR